MSAQSRRTTKGVSRQRRRQTVPNAQPDTVAIIDLSANPPKLLAELQVPASVAGPPGSVAVAADESLAPDAVARLHYSAWGSHAATTGSPLITFLTNGTEC